MWSPSTHANLNRDVLNVLNIGANRANLVELGFGVRGQFTCLGRSPVIRFRLPVAKFTVPARNIGPLLEWSNPRVLCAFGWKILYREARDQICKVWAGRFFFQRRQALQLPGVSVAVDGRLTIRVV